MITEKTHRCRQVRMDPKTYDRDLQLKNTLIPEKNWVLFTLFICTGRCLIREIQLLRYTATNKISDHRP